MSLLPSSQGADLPDVAAVDVYDLKAPVPLDGYTLLLPEFCCTIIDITEAAKRDTISLDRPNDRTTARSFQTRAPLPVANWP